MRFEPQLQLSKELFNAIVCRIAFFKNFTLLDLDFFLKKCIDKVARKYTRELENDQEKKSDFKRIILNQNLFSIYMHAHLASVSNTCTCTYILFDLSRAFDPVCRRCLIYDIYLIF